METRTRTESRRLLESAGYPPAAVEIVLKWTAPLRHKERVETVHEVLREYLDTAPPEERAGLARILLSLELAGIGGRMDVEGLATTRLAPFATLGKGRRNATDGPAWNAALRDALRESGGRPAVEWNREARRLTAAGIPLVPGRIPSRWLLAELRRGVLYLAWRTGDMAGQPPRPALDWDSYTSWSSLVGGGAAHIRAVAQDLAAQEWRTGAGLYHAQLYRAWQEAEEGSDEEAAASRALAEAGAGWPVFPSRWEEEEWWREVAP
jgi:hypothetical protein